MYLCITVVSLGSWFVALMEYLCYAAENAGGTCTQGVMKYVVIL